VILCADEKSVITYLVAFYHYFSKLKSDEVDMKRLNKLLIFLLEMEAMQRQYEALASELLAWIDKYVAILQNQSFPNNLPGLLALLADFKTYRTVVKPPRFVDRGHLEAHLFSIQTKLFAHKQSVYHPPEGLLISDINARWQLLEQCEHMREVALRGAVLRQEQLQQLAIRFDNKASLREAWLADNEKIIAIDDFGSDLAGAIAALKRHEAIETDVLAHRDRCEAVARLSEQLVVAGFHGADDIADRTEAILGRWRAIQDHLSARRLRLDEAMRVHKAAQDIKDVAANVADLMSSLATTTLGRHLGECEDALQRHALREQDAAMLLDRVCVVNAHAQVFVDQASLFVPLFLLLLLLPLSHFVSSSS
jgi:spectrin beta